jgi:hypothetical protein
MKWRVVELICRPPSGSSKKWLQNGKFSDAGMQQGGGPGNLWENNSPRVSEKSKTPPDLKPCSKTRSLLADATANSKGQPRWPPPGFSG